MILNEEFGNTEFSTTTWLYDTSFHTLYKAISLKGISRSITSDHSISS